MFKPLTETQMKSAVGGCDLPDVAKMFADPRYAHYFGVRNK